MLSRCQVASDRTEAVLLSGLEGLTNTRFLGP